MHAAALDAANMKAEIAKAVRALDMKGCLP